ncbi:MAG: GatB/YqeY domain-containing protein [Ignavibacteria bacterium]|nr:GatB/YqeY domain-containing protein [Ignavibacteria bacterium]
MSLTETINAHIKEAMLAGEKLRLETLRSIRALIIEFEKSGVGRDMNPDDELSLLNSAAKKRKDAISQYNEVGRLEAAQKEREELVIIQQYLPEQLSEADIRKAIQDVISTIGATGPADMGKVMGGAMKQLKGKADGTLIQTLVKELLSSL